MKQYRIEVTGDRFPTTYNVEATSWGTAVSRGIREWQKRFKGSRTKELTIRAIVGEAKEVPTEI